MDQVQLYAGLYTLVGFIGLIINFIAVRNVVIYMYTHNIINYYSVIIIIIFFITKLFIFYVDIFALCCCRSLDHKIETEIL